MNLQAPPPKPLIVGDFLPMFSLIDQNRNAVTPATHALGKPIVVLFYPGNHLAAAQQMLRRFAELHEALDRRAHLFAINGDSLQANIQAAALHHYPFRLLADDTRAAAAAYGVGHNLPGAALDFLGSGGFTSVIADANRRILQVNRNVADPEHAAQVLAFVETLDPGEGQILPPPAPLLYVPRVFDRDLCDHLIQVFETQGNVVSGTLHDRPDGQSEERLDATRKVRRDHHIRDPQLQARIGEPLKARVLPEIVRAFAYRVTHFEEFKIVRYDASDSGHFATHRDNTTLSAAHRRFAMTLNLNSGDYEGGCLRFPEYGPHLYRPDTGDAVIFSCSLAHQATPVTAGQRYVLLAFLYGAEGLEMKRRRESALQASAS